jgi:hypothetical protein
MPLPKWMYGCAGRVGGIGIYAAARPSLTGLHRFDRMSRKKEDDGKTQCQVCDQRPPSSHEAEAWEFLMQAEAEQARVREQSKLMRLARKSYAE